MTPTHSAWHVRLVNSADADIWLNLRQGLWPDTPTVEHQTAIAAFFAGTAPEPLAVLIAETDQQQAIGFAELSIRTYAEGCDTQRVAYLEGWYVVAEYRHQGVGRALIDAADDWGRSQGCTEFASDAEADNLASWQAHVALGFEDVGLIRCFRKSL
ncbi:aminoglycoside 6'-N-acetyltransferase [Leptolyngbya iicbica]|uniref:Aminoglycoside N(6')-acetyltransferase type 1 n=2 Tax=Cyanophyceae TaxID=3028117 RepID=A0A4V2E3N3_9CYAN|nr:GNAT family N-acetyltransferase [Leptolyngbya sp. LK]